jgi:hypothetical protein
LIEPQSFIDGRGITNLLVASSLLAAAFDEIRHRQDLARRTETALFDLIFLADQLTLGGDVVQAPLEAQSDEALPRMQVQRSVSPNFGSTALSRERPLTALSGSLVERPCASGFWP